MKYLVIATFISFIIEFSQANLNLSARLVVREGEKVTYPIPEDDYDILSCVAVHNDQVYNIYPISNLTNGVDESNSHLCTLGFSKISLSDAGKWTIHTTSSVFGSGIRQSTYTAEIYVHMKTVLLPKSWFLAEIGNYITVFPQHKLSSFTNCSVKHYKFALRQDNYDLLNLNQDDLGIERYGKCGVRIRVDESKYGSWELLQTDGPYKLIKQEFRIWKSYENNLDDNINLVWHYGLPAEIGIPEYLKSTYCKIIQPDGQYTIIELNNCKKKIDAANYKHEGVWEIRYYIPELLDILTQQFHVKVLDGFQAHDNISITVKAKNNQTHLLCSLSGIESEFCLFTKPDGSVLNIPQGIGNNKYEYYGKGFHYRVSKKPHSDCGLTIYQPSIDDFGLWECSFGRNSKSPEIYKAFLSFIDTKTVSTTGAYIPNQFYVKRGDSLQIECPRYALLNYCWLYSPKGTIYARSNHINSNNTSFKNRDLAASICSTTIENADYEHSGNWSCLLNPVGGDEIKVSNAIAVTVTDSYLYANQNEIKIKQNEKTNLTLSTLPGKDLTIVYCRWHYPNGIEVERKNSSQYSFSHDQKSCSLIINEYNDKNIGKWTCYAGLVDNSNGEVFNKEVSATITVMKSEEPFVETIYVKFNH